MLSNVSNDSLPYGVMSYFIFLITSLIFPDRYANMATGLAIKQAKQSLAATHPDYLDVILGWTMLGDPMTVLNQQ